MIHWLTPPGCYPSPYLRSFPVFSLRVTRGAAGDKEQQKAAEGIKDELVVDDLRQCQFTASVFVYIDVRASIPVSPSFRAADRTGIGCSHFAFFKGLLYPGVGHRVVV